MPLRRRPGSSRGAGGTRPGARRVQGHAPPAAAVLLAVLSAGCAASGPGSPGPVGLPAVRAASSTRADQRRADSGPAPTGTVTVQGVVERGVEPGCLVLRAGGKSYTLLQGADATPREGVHCPVPVEVEAKLLPAWPATASRALCCGWSASAEPDRPAGGPGDRADRPGVAGYAQRTARAAAPCRL